MPSRSNHYSYSSTTFSERRIASTTTETGYLDAGQAIQIFRLLPGSGHDIVAGTLHAANIRVPPLYEAFSYNRSAKGSAQLILLDGKEVSVPHEVWKGLKTIRRSGFHLDLWVDVLCVDQNDEEEKMRHLTMMGRIYNRARSVLVWVGDEDGTEDGKILMTSDWNDDEVWLKYCNEWKKMLAKPYWTQTWTVQDILNGETVDVFYGSSYVLYRPVMDRLYKVPPTMRPVVARNGTWSYPARVKTDFREDGPDFAAWCGWSTLHGIETTREQPYESDDSFDGGGLFYMQTLALRFEHSLCEERRDRWYALQALVEHGRWAEEVLVNLHGDSDVANLWFDVFLETVNYTGEADMRVADAVISCLQMTSQEILAAADICLGLLGDGISEPSKRAVLALTEFFCFQNGQLVSAVDRTDLYRTKKTLQRLRDTLAHHISKEQASKDKTGKGKGKGRSRFGITSRLSLPWRFKSPPLTSRRIVHRSVAFPRRRDHTAHMEVMKKDAVLDESEKLVWRPHMPLH